MSDSPGLFLQTGAYLKESVQQFRIFLSFLGFEMLWDRDKMSLIHQKLVAKDSECTSLTILSLSSTTIWCNDSGLVCSSRKIIRSAQTDRLVVLEPLLFVCRRIL